MLVGSSFTSRWLTLACAALLCTTGFSQAWDYSYQEYVMEEIPIYKMIKETMDSATGYYDHGNGMSIKALRFELGGCSMGHPCAQYTGASQLPPDGCPLESQCSARWVGDPWRSYDSLCYETVTMDNLATQEVLYKDITLLVTEWFEFDQLDCQLRRNPDDTWTQEVEGVAIVIRAKGFEFPAQTVIVSDIDTVPDFEAALYPNIMQEASINFAMKGNSFVKPTNYHASDFFTPAELAGAPDILDPITVTLSQGYLDALDLGMTETTVDASIAGLTSDKIFNFPEFWYPDWQADTAGGVVWADFTSEFDTMVHSMALGKKLDSDSDQMLSLYPLKARTRCRCSLVSGVGTIVRPEATEGVCKVYVGTVNSYGCDGSGLLYCNEVIRTVWDRTTAEDGDGNVGCAPRNATKAVFEVAVAEVGPPNYTWPAVTPSPIAVPSGTPNASPTPSSSVSASPSETPF